MRVDFLEGTDTLQGTFKDSILVDTRDVDEDTLVEADDDLLAEQVIEPVGHFLRPFTMRKMLRPIGNAVVSTPPRMILLHVESRSVGTILSAPAHVDRGPDRAVSHADRPRGGARSRQRGLPKGSATDGDHRRRPLGRLEREGRPEGPGDATRYPSPDRLAAGVSRSRACRYWRSKPAS